MKLTNGNNGYCSPLTDAIYKGAAFTKNISKYSIKEKEDIINDLIQKGYKRIRIYASRSYVPGFYNYHVLAK